MNECIAILSLARGVSGDTWRVFRVASNHLRVVFARQVSAAVDVREDCSVYLRAQRIGLITFSFMAVSLESAYYNSMALRLGFREL